MAKPEDETPMTYEIGYAKPPVANRFKKGVSGNPSGKAKRPPGTETSVRKVLRRRVRVTVEGKRKIVPYTEAMVMQMAQRALAGDVKSQREMLKLAREYAEPDEPWMTTPPGEIQDFHRYTYDMDSIVRGLLQLGVMHFEGQRLKIDPEFLYAHLGRDFETKPHRDVRAVMDHYYAGTPSRKLVSDREAARKDKP